MTAPGRSPRRRVRIDAVLHTGIHLAWPLFIVNNDNGDQPDGAPISAELKQDLRIWAGHHREHYDEQEGGWVPTDSALVHNRLGRRLGNRLATELGPRFRVMLDIHGSPTEESGWEEIPGIRQPKHRSPEP